MDKTRVDPAAAAQERASNAWDGFFARLRSVAIQEFTKIGMEANLRGTDTAVLFFVPTFQMPAGTMRPTKLTDRGCQLLSWIGSHPWRSQTPPTGILLRARGSLLVEAGGLILWNSLCVILPVEGDIVDVDYVADITGFYSTWEGTYYTWPTVEETNEGVRYISPGLAVRNAAVEAAASVPWEQNPLISDTRTHARQEQDPESEVTREDVEEARVRKRSSWGDWSEDSFGTFEPEPRNVFPPSPPQG